MVEYGYGILKKNLKGDAVGLSVGQPSCRIFILGWQLCLKVLCDNYESKNLSHLFFIVSFSKYKIMISHNPFSFVLNECIQTLTHAML